MNEGKHDFEIGDKVLFTNRRGPLMTVNACSIVGIHCEWKEGDDLKENVFDPWHLKKANVWRTHAR